MNRTIILGAAALLLAGTATASIAPRVETALPSSSAAWNQTHDGALLLADRDRRSERRVVGREVCEDVEVTERRERDGNAGGTVAGAVIGGLIGSQVGSGSGRKAATVAGAVAGGVAGNRIDKNHDGGKRRTHVERECHTVYDDDRRYR
jgi:uncharacterized protein YcfJ